MSKEERHLQTKIRMFEDILLRTKNPSQSIFLRSSGLSLLHAISNRRKGTGGYSAAI